MRLLKPRTSSFAISLFVCLILPGTRCAAQSSPPNVIPPYLDASQPIQNRVDDLVSSMTLEEKASQLVNQSRAIPRLNVPKYDWRSEALHGIAGAGIATVFP